MLISMNVGGTERAFLNMLQQLSENEYEITVLLLQRKGGLYQEIPEYVNVIEMQDFPLVHKLTSYNPKAKLVRYLSKHCYKQAFSLLILHIYMKITKSRKVLFKKAFKNIPMLEKKYDIAVAFAGPMDIITYYIVKRVKATEKYQWIHFDVNHVGFDLNFAKKMYKHFNCVYVVSKTATLHLQEKLPTLINKIKTQTNTIPAITINELARKEEVLSSSSTIKIVTVARIMKEKGPDIAVKVLSKLKKLGYNIKWYWIGKGEWSSYIEVLIKELKIEDSFILEGLKSNPYPYMRQSDIYVQPSRHEGYCLTIAEAKILNKPIVTTATAGGEEQIKHRKTGLISEINERDLMEKIIELIENPKLKNSLCYSLQKENESKITPFYLSAF